MQNHLAHFVGDLGARFGINGTFDSESQVGPSSASVFQPLSGLVWSCERHRGGPGHGSRSGWPEKGCGGHICHKAGCPSSQGLGTRAVCGPGLRGPLEEPHAGEPGGQAAEEGPGPAGLHRVASSSGPALQGPPAGRRETGPVPDTVDARVPPTPGQQSPCCPEAECQVGVWGRRAAPHAACSSVCF